MASATSESKLHAKSGSPSFAVQSCDESISFQTLKTFISKAIKELKEELTLDFELQLSTLSAEVVSLREEVAALKAEACASSEGLKDQILSELREQESRKCNVMIFGAKEPESPDGSMADVSDIHNSIFRS